MKKFIALVVSLSLFTICCPIKIYAEGLSVTQKVLNVYYNFVQNEKVAKTINSIQLGWKSFKKWVANLPGIKEYNNSIYSSKNWKRTMNDMGNEYRQHI